MMKNKLIIGAVSAAVILGGAFAVGAANNDIPTVNLQQTSKEKNIISSDEAVNIALTKVKGTVEKVELESEHGHYYYEVEIDTVDTEYDFDIDAVTGEILTYKEDKQDDDYKMNIIKESNATQNNYITSEKAIEIAEKEVNGKVVEIDRDDEDGRIIYEIELKTNNGEAELKLDAVTGKVLKMEYED